MTLWGQRLTCVGASFKRTEWGHPEKEPRQAEPQADGGQVWVSVGGHGAPRLIRHALSGGGRSPRELPHLVQT